MSLIGRIVEKVKEKKKKREDMCLPELEKEIKTRKWTFLIIYCAFIFFAYLGFVLTVEISQLIALLFITMLCMLFTIVSAMDYLFTRLIYYLKFNLEE